MPQLGFRLDIEIGFRVWGIGFREVVGFVSKVLKGLLICVGLFMGPYTISICPGLEGLGFRYPQSKGFYGGMQGTFALCTYIYRYIYHIYIIMCGRFGTLGVGVKGRGCKDSGALGLRVWRLPATWVRVAVLVFGERAGFLRNIGEFMSLWGDHL